MDHRQDRRWAEELYAYEDRPLLEDLLEANQGAYHARVTRMMLRCQENRMDCEERWQKAFNDWTRKHPSANKEQVMSACQLQCQKEIISIRHCMRMAILQEIQLTDYIEHELQLFCKDYD